MKENVLIAPASAKDQTRGSLFLGCDEKKSARKTINFELEVEGLPSCSNMMQCNFSTTYFLEIHRCSPAGGATTKFYESEYFVDEFDYAFSPMEFTDQQLCNGDENSEIRFSFFNRN